MTGRNSERLRRLYQAMDRRGLDAVALVPGATFFHLTGVHFHLQERPTVLLVARNGAHRAVIPALERERWAAAAPDVETVYWQDADGYEDAFAKVALAGVPRRIGIEGQRMRAFELTVLQRHFGEVIDAQADIAELRLLKDAEAIAAMRRAIAVSERALDKTLRQVAVGQSEAQIRSVLIGEMFAAGADALAFDPIVLTGGASADPHGSSTHERLVTAGAPLLIDFGAAVDSYNADITRTVFVGQPSEEHRNIYAAVLAANEKARADAKPGLMLHELDFEHRALLAEKGYEAMIVHKLGHGLGLDVHEAPQVMIGNRAPLEPGMVITIEPGLYQAGNIGVRIEDDVLITAEGSDTLTSFRRELTIL